MIGNLSSTRVLPIEITPGKESPARAGQHQGVNRPVKGTNADGDVIVFKHNSEQGLGKLAKYLPADYSRKMDVKEVVASHIMADEFQQNSVTLQEGFYVDAQGQRHEGIVSKFVSGMSTLSREGVGAVTNPDQAVEQNVVKGWMGDWDIVTNGSNLWMTADGQTVAGDYGNSLQKGISDLGFPRANIKIMQAYSKPENVDPMVARITSLSDGDIENMVDRVGQKWIHDWTPDQGREMTEVLQHNRDLLKQNNPFDDYYAGFHPQTKPAGIKALRPALLYWPAVKWKIHVAAESLRERFHR